MPSTQLLAFIENLQAVGVMTRGAVVALSTASGRTSVIITALGAAQSPRPVAGTALVANYKVAATAVMTNAGIANMPVGVRFNLGAKGTALSGSYNPRSDLGLIPYGGVVGNIASPPALVTLSNAAVLMPTTLAVGAGYVSPPIDCMRLKHVAWALTSNQTVNLSITRYADNQGANSIGVLTATATANAAMSIDTSSDSKLFGSFSLGATNTSGSIATFSSVSLLLAAA